MSSSNSNSNSRSLALGMADSYHVNIGPAGLEKDTRRGVFLDTTHTAPIDVWDIVSPDEEERQFIIEQFHEGKGSKPFWETGKDKVNLLGIFAEALGNSVSG